MNLFDIVGPVMIGPSSSHTAGAVRIGRLAGRLMGEEIREAEVLFHGSFLATGKGHGTDRAVVAGLMGLDVDDARVPESLTLAPGVGLTVRFGSIDLGDDVHPNSLKLKLTGKSGKRMELAASSIGGGRIRIFELDGVKASFSGDQPTLIISNLDEPGLVAEVAALLQKGLVNIATMQLYRAGRGGMAVMVIVCDDEVPADALQKLRELDGVEKVTYLGS